MKNYYVVRVSNSNPSRARKLEVRTRPMFKEDALDWIDFENSLQSKKNKKHKFIVIQTEDSI